MFDLDTNGRIPAPAQPGSKTQGSVAVLDLVADKWTMRVVYTLKNGSRHYGEILRTIEGYSGPLCQDQKSTKIRTEVT